MKFNTKTFKFVVAAFIVVIASTCLVFAKLPALLQQINLEITHGEVRVVLMRAGQVVSTNGQTQFMVTYAVEIPDKGAFSDLSFSSSDELNLAARGKKIEFSDVASCAMGFDELQKNTGLSEPSKNKGKAMIFQDILIGNLDGDLKLDAKKVDVIVQFNWRKTPQKFVFKDVSLN